MSHEVETMFSARELPWHGLGVVTADALTGDEALVTAGLDWEVDLAPLTADVGFEVLEVPDTFATYRVKEGRSEVLGVVGDNYTPVQNRELFRFGEALVSTGEAMWETAGSLRGGRVVFATASLNREVVVAGDKHIPYLVMASSHDASMAMKALLTPVRVVCMNTLRLSLSRARSAYTIRHTPNVGQYVAQAREALQLSWTYLDGFEAEVNQLIDQTVTDRQWNELISTLIPDLETDSKRKATNVEQRRSDITQVYRTDPACRPWAGSAWGALNAVNTWELWQSPIRQTEGVTRWHGNDTQAIRLDRQAMHLLRDNEQRESLTRRAHVELVKVRQRTVTA